MPPEDFPRNQESAEVEKLRYEIEEKLFAASDIVEQRLPDVPDRQMLRHLLGATAHLVGPAYQRDSWRSRARLLRNDLQGALSELERMEKSDSE
jgi:hypothetical protein